jgi:hypothetical protein
MLPVLSQGGWVNVDIRGNTIGAPIGSGGPIIDIIPANRDIRPSTGSKLKRKALDGARDLGESALDKGKAALKQGIDTALKSNPATAPFAIGADALGVNPFGGGGKSWIEQLQDWIKESGIFQRLALAIMAFVFIAVALSMFGRQNLVGTLTNVVKGK